MSQLIWIKYCIVHSLDPFCDDSTNSAISYRPICSCIVWFCYQRVNWQKTNEFLNCFVTRGPITYLCTRALSTLATPLIIVIVTVIRSEEFGTLMTPFDRLGSSHCTTTVFELTGRARTFLGALSGATPAKSWFIAVYTQTRLTHKYTRRSKRFCTDL